MTILFFFPESQEVTAHKTLSVHGFRHDIVENCHVRYDVL